MTDATKTVRCGSCGHENLPDAEVCTACGASLAAYRSISTAVPEARQPATTSSPRNESRAATPPAIGMTKPAEPPPATAPPASPIGDALAKIRERTDEERADQPSLTAAVDEDAGTSSVAFTPPAGQSDAPLVASTPQATTTPSASPSPPAVERPRTRAASPQSRQTGNQTAARRETATAPKRDERRRAEPIPVLTPPHWQGPDRLARASAATLITWGIVLVAFSFVLGIALPGARHQALGEAIVTIVTLMGIVLFVIGLARKSGARRPADRRPPRRR